MIRISLGSLLRTRSGRRKASFRDQTYYRSVDGGTVALHGDSAPERTSLEAARARPELGRSSWEQSGDIESASVEGDSNGRTDCLGP